jgi:hypothetical protein
MLPPDPQIVRPVTTSPEYLIPDSGTPESSTSGPIPNAKDAVENAEPGRLHRPDQPPHGPAPDRPELGHGRGGAGDQRSGARPARARARLSPTAGSSAWCTAAASYSSYYGDWDVYVHSNQPGTAVTASGGSYSHSWHTNSSGYADIYLRGPSPGQTITVTAGPATCSTTAG